MRTVYCFSGSGHSFAVADFFAKGLNCDLVEIGGKYEEEENEKEKEKNCGEETAVVVFPVYCQNIPEPVKLFLKDLDSKYIVLIATYGKISYGNVLYEAQKILRGQVIAGAYVPTGHTFLKENSDFDTNALLPIFRRISSPQSTYIPRSRKNLFADFFPARRSRIGVKITQNNACLSCDICGTNCPVGAIKNGRINSGCIRCLRCVTDCPQDALQFKNRWILKKYLEGRRKEELILYL